MREILFRAKRLSDGEWIDGSLFIDEKKDKHEILVGYVNYRIGWEVDPETVGQFTGLTDKNGNRIFEGDILRWIGPDGEGGKVYVTFTRGVFGFQSIECPLAAPDLFADFETGNQTLEVIGNIHDNPELLEAQS